ncbi:MAG: membrane dipeptidase [Oscillospiraceae bacterium]|nr:membrane dipeptidase [Oscillospiraceae bacterium]
MNGKIPYFDLHCDTASVIPGRCRLRANDLHIDLERGGIFTPRAQVFAYFSDGGSYADYVPQHENFMRELEKNDDLVTLCKDGKAVRKAAEEGKTAAILMVEGAETLDGSTERLREAREDGVRIVTITWNHANKLSGSNVDKRDEGLTPAGREFIRECEKLGVIPDVSHLSDPGFWDLIETATKPIIATHSNARALWNHTRNLTDDMFKALIATGGIVGINLYGAFLSDEPCIGDVIRHIGHFLDLGGEKHLAIGADLDGCDILPREINAVEDMTKLYEAVVSEFGEGFAEDIFYNNAAALFDTL